LEIIDIYLSLDTAIYVGVSEAVGSLIHEVLKQVSIIDVGERSIVRVAVDYGSGKPRFAINLPTARNDLWEYLWRRRIKVKIYLEVPAPDQRGDDLEPAV